MKLANPGMVVNQHTLIARAKQEVHRHSGLPPDGHLLYFYASSLPRLGRWDQAAERSHLWRIIRSGRDDSGGILSRPFYFLQGGGGCLGSSFVYHPRSFTCSGTPVCRFPLVG